jgi:MFS family permease
LPEIDLHEEENDLGETLGRLVALFVRRRWWILSVLCLSLLIVFVGNSSLNVAIPTLSRELHATESQLQWVVAIYSLVFAGLLFTTGALGDRFGRKGALQFGLATFFLASLLASQATDTSQIIACRAVMGVGAAFIMPSTLSILVNVFPPRERAKAIAIWATTTGVAGSIGPVITGYVLGHFSADMSWAEGAFLPFASLATTPPHLLARPLPIEYIAVGLIGALTGFWTGQRMEHVVEHELT